jgi:hypothetical protein
LQLNALTYVAGQQPPCVEDFDRMGINADVTYCPNSNFASPEAPPWQFRAKTFAGILWHNDCSS